MEALGVPMGCGGVCEQRMFKKKQTKQDFALKYHTDESDKHGRAVSKQDTMSFVWPLVLTLRAQSDFPRFFLELGRYRG